MPSDSVVTSESVESDADLEMEEGAAVAPDTVGESGAAVSMEPTAGDAAGEAADGPDGEASEVAGEPDAVPWLELAHAALTGPRERFHSTLVVTADQLRSYVEAHRTTDSDTVSRRAAVELGPFASGRIDPQKFAELVSEAEGSDPASVEPMQRALDALSALIDRGEELHFVRVTAGGDLTEAVGRALAEAGRAFGAARVFEVARRGTYDPQVHDLWLASFPFREWSRAERELAPPLVVEVEGRDLRAAGLADFLDGRQKLVLLVRGDSPPAPLVRLVSPGVMVLQTDDPARLTRLAEVEGPAIGAVVPEGAGRFEHEPGETGQPGRLEVVYVPDQVPRRRLGSLSAFQQAEELRQLSALAVLQGGPAAAPAPGPGAAPAAGPDTTPTAVPTAASPADEKLDRLAAWLLDQADLSDL